MSRWTTRGGAQWVLAGAIGASTIWAGAVAGAGDAGGSAGSAGAGDSSDSSDTGTVAEAADESGGSASSGDRVVRLDRTTGEPIVIESAEVSAVGFGRVQLRWGGRFENIPVEEIASIAFAADGPLAARWRAWDAVRMAAERDPRSAALPLARLIDEAGDAGWAAVMSAATGVHIGDAAGAPNAGDARAIERLAARWREREGRREGEAGARSGGSLGAHPSGRSTRVRQTLERLAAWAGGASGTAGRSAAVRGSSAMDRDEGSAQPWPPGSAESAVSRAAAGATTASVATAGGVRGPTESAGSTESADPARVATAWLRVGLMQPRGRGPADALIAAAELYAGPLGDRAAADRILVRGLQLRARWPEGSEHRRLTEVRTRLATAETAGRVLLRPEFDTAAPKPR
ncbi:MAG: hypothetical protein AB8G96_14410 [Phycisphaerales bacterium]